MRTNAHHQPFETLDVTLMICPYRRVARKPRLLVETPLIKIRSDHMLAFDESTTDPALALYLNPPVIKQKLAFCKWHFEQDWPDFHRDLAAAYQQAC